MHERCFPALTCLCSGSYAAPAKTIYLSTESVREARDSYLETGHLERKDELLLKGLMRKEAPLLASQGKAHSVFTPAAAVFVGHLPLTA